MVELALAGVVPSVEGSEDDCFEKQEKEPHLLKPDLPYFPSLMADPHQTRIVQYQNKPFNGLIQNKSSISCSMPWPHSKFHD